MGPSTGVSKVLVTLKYARLPLVLLIQPQSFSFQFNDVAVDKYLSDKGQKTRLHNLMADYFMGIWSGGRPKPFR